MLLTVSVSFVLIVFLLIPLYFVLLTVSLSLFDHFLLLLLSLSLFLWTNLCHSHVSATYVGAGIRIIQITSCFQVKIEPPENIWNLNISSNRLIDSTTFLFNFLNVICHLLTRLLHTLKGFWYNILIDKIDYFLQRWGCQWQLFNNVISNWKICF